MKTDTEKKKADLMKSLELTKSGFAGVIEIDGVIRKVDRRNYPHSIPMPENKMLGIPAPVDTPDTQCHAHTEKP